MASGRITKLAVDALEATGAEYFFWDDRLRGFGVRVSAAGVRTYIVAYRVGGREAAKRRAKIGQHGSPWTPDTARKEAQRLLHLVGQKIDPAAVERTRRREVVTLAFDAYAANFTTSYLKVRWPGAWELADGILRREAVPAFAGLALPQITRSHVIDLLDGLAGRPAVRRNAFAVLRRLFRWAVSRGDIERSPIADMEAPPAPAARDRVLSDEDLTLAWQGAEVMPYPFGPLIRLLIVTGQRRNEVAGLRWSELQRGDAIWLLPAARAKNNAAHLVPLSPIAIEVLDEIAMQLAPVEEGKPIEWPEDGFVFTTTGNTSVTGYSKAKLIHDGKIVALLAKAAAAAGKEPRQVAPWRLHDLRRTCATGLQRLGVRFEVTEAVLNHLSGAKSGIAGVYQRHDWKDEKRAALNAWGRHVASLLRPIDHTNVVALSERRAG